MNNKIFIPEQELLFLNHTWWFLVHIFGRVHLQRMPSLQSEHWWLPEAHYQFQNKSHDTPYSPSACFVIVWGLNVYVNHIHSFILFFFFFFFVVVCDLCMVDWLVTDMVAFDLYTDCIVYYFIMIFSLSLSLFYLFLLWFSLFSVHIPCRIVLTLFFHC